MKSFNRGKRLTAVALALVFCVCALFYPAETANNALAKNIDYNDPIVKVGLYVQTSMLDARRFSSLNVSESGFDIGFSKYNSFTSLFSIPNNQIVILPQVNANIDLSSELKNCVISESGNIGSYSVILGKHSTFSSAQAEANRHSSGFVAIVNGGYEVRAYASTSKEAAEALSGGRPVATPTGDGITVLDALNGKILFTYENPSGPFAIRAADSGRVTLPVKTGRTSTSRFAYNGYFEYKVANGLLLMYNCLPLEDYTKCVMANEIGTNISKETRKAFSVLARTVALYSKHSKAGYDVCNNAACCQVYFGTYRMSEENNAIVDSTRGQYCSYKGEPIAVLYHNSNGGASCSSAAAWGGEGLPYLVTVIQEEQGGDSWQYEYTKQEFYKYLKSRSAFSSLEDPDISFKILETDPYGSDYITVLSVSDGSGNVVEIEYSEAVRTACGFTSANFKINYVSETTVLTADGTVENRKVSGVMTADGYKPFDNFGDEYILPSGDTLSPQKVIIDGEGVGHGVGFSATGSEKLVSEGYSYAYIIKFFFNGTVLKHISDDLE